MRVAVVNLTGGGLSGGYLEYLEHLLPLLLRDPRVDHLDAYIPPEAPWAGAPGIESLRWPQGDSRRGYRGLRARLDQTRPDVVFFPTARWLPTGRPTVVMVQNMEPLARPFGGNGPVDVAKNLVRRYLAWAAVHRADRVIAVSGFVRDFLVRRWKAAPGKVAVVYHGVEAPPVPSLVARPQALQGLSDWDFLFTAGSIRPSRGLEDLIGAMVLLKDRGVGLRLVIGGQADRHARFYQQRLERLARELRVAQRIIWAGHLDRHEMSWCLAHCRLYVMTSRVEACPITALEAMSHGCEIVSSDPPPMPEILGDAAVYYRAGDTAALAERIRERLDAGRANRAHLQGQALARAGRFTWGGTARQTVDQLSAALTPRMLVA